MGPLLTDKKFFTEIIDCTLKGLEDIPSYAQKEDFASCRRIFAEFFRNYLEPEKYFSAKTKGMVNNMSKGGRYKDAEGDEIIEAAEKACRHYMVSCGIPSDFGENKVDWYSNPTHNNYMEWPWQLSRHPELNTLATAYTMTGNEKYAYACAELFDSWVKQAEAPAALTPHGDTLSWRTIECGIRQGGCWPNIIHSLYKTAAFTDDIITDWCKSVWEHGDRLYTVHGGNNWLLMEMNGLAHIGVIYGFFKESKEWLRFAIEVLDRELTRQVYPDGFQYELTTDYQSVAITNYSAVLRLLLAYGIEPNENTAAYIERMLEVYVHLTEPDGLVPDINDGMKYNTKEYISRYSAMFPQNEIFKWVLTDGKEGKAPEKDHIFKNAGLAVLRTGLTEDDTWLFFDGGEFGAGHQHEDKLNLLMYADGKLILTESGKYAYDASFMSKYTLSTRSHNTVRVDGMGQYRRKNYKWDGSINKISDLKYELSDGIDTLSAVYDEGYGNKRGETSARHERKVKFIKNIEGLRPFAVVFDRLYSEEEHTYGILWHLDSENISCSGMDLRARTLNVMVPPADAEKVSLSICRGQQYPEIQGFFCKSHNQFDYRPIYCAEYKVKGKDVRFVTVLYPDGFLPNPIEGVKASFDVNDKGAVLLLKDGRRIAIEE